MMMEQLGIKKMRRSIVEMLKDEILSGNIPCQTEMTQNELASSLGVPRMPVRGAPIILEYQGLIERFPNNHAWVAEFSADYFKRLFCLCGKLELEEIVRQQAMEQSEVPPPETSLPGEMEFCRELHRKSGHSYIRKTLQTVAEIYIAFALKCRDYELEQGWRLLGQVMEIMSNGAHERAEKDSGVTASESAEVNQQAAAPLNQYFDILTEAIMRERARQVLGLKPIKLLPAGEQVTSAPRKAIISRQIAEGEVLTLETTAQNLGVLATPVREAFQILARDGLTDLKQSKGAVVPDINKTTIREHYQAWAALGSAARATCCEEMVSLEATENCPTSAREALEADDSSSYSSFNQSFHYEIWMAAGNERLKNTLSELWNGLSMDIRTAEHECARRSQGEHERIFEALKIRDADKASSKMCRHIPRSMEGVLTRYQQ